MKHFKTLSVFSLVILAVAISLQAFAADKKFEGKGEVVTVDPVYKRITIRHEAIKDFAAGGETEFLVKSEKELEGLAKYDLVTFSISEKKGDARIESLKKTGVGAPPDDRVLIGQAAQGVIEATGEVAKAVTSPLPPVNTAVSGAVDTTTEATGEALKDVTPDVKAKF